MLSNPVIVNTKLHCSWLMTEEGASREGTINPISIKLGIFDLNSQIFALKRLVKIAVFYITC